MSFTGNTKLTSGIKQKNNLTFPLVQDIDVYIEDDDSLPRKYKSLKDKLDEIDTSTSTGVDNKIKTAIENLDSDKSVETKSGTTYSDHMFAKNVVQEDGKITHVYGVQPVINDVDGLQDALDSKQGNMTAGTGININVSDNNTIGVTDEVYQNVVDESGYTELGTTLGVEYSSDEHKMETVLDDLADRAVDCDDRLGILEYSNFTVSSGSCTPAEAENGDVINSVTLKWSVSVPSLPGETKHPRKQEIRNSNGSTIIKEVESVSARQTSISSLNITSNTSWRMYAYITDSLSKYTTGSITFKDRLYYGHKQIPSSSSEYNETFIKSLQSNKLVTSSNYKSVFGTITFSMSSNEYAYIAIPTSYGIPTFSIDGSSTVLFNVKENITYTNGSVTTKYNIYESPNSGGSYTITLV